jgi:hypothetical protein
MRTEQKLILAVGVLAGGFALSLPFRREAPSALSPKPTQAGFSRDLNLTLRRDSVAPESNQLTPGRPSLPPLARITAIPDEERTAAQKKKPVPAPTSPSGDNMKTDTTKTDATHPATTKVETTQAEAPGEASPPPAQVPLRPLGHIRSLKPL